MEWPTIWFGIIFWKELIDKIPWVKPMEKIINLHIQLPDYGEGLKTIRFVLIAVHPTNKIHKEKIRYSSRKKDLLLYQKLDYEATLKADEPTFQNMVASLFVNAIDKYPKHRVKDFDWQQFKLDVKHLFEKKGWLPVVERA